MAERLEMESAVHHYILFSRACVLLWGSKAVKVSQEKKSTVILGAKTASEIGRLGADARWGPRRELIADACELAEKLWAEGDSLWHSKMADYLLEMQDYMNLQNDRSALIQALKPVAKRFGKVRGLKGSKK